MDVGNAARCIALENNNCVLSSLLEADNFSLKNIMISTCSRDVVSAEYRPVLVPKEPSGISRFMPLMRSLDAVRVEY